jgi:hypothetical protein
MVIGADTDVHGPIWGMPATDPGGNRMLLVWPQGFTARINEPTLQIIDPGGRVVAGQGSLLKQVQICALPAGKYAVDAFEGYGIGTPPP